MVSAIRITKNDINVLREINRFGYADVFYLAKKFQFHPVSLYRRLKKLSNEHYLKHQIIYHHEPGIYWVTPKGIQLSKDKIQAISNINNATFHHQQSVLHLSLVLTNKEGGQFITERELRHSSILSGIGNHGHICDGVLILSDRKIAIEVELSHKSKHRLKKILDNYWLEFDFDAVWYFCGNQSILKRLQKLTSEYDFLEVHDLRDYLEEDFLNAHQIF